VTVDHVVVEVEFLNTATESHPRGLDLLERLVETADPRLAGEAAKRRLALLPPLL
jgi:hypothetical protein